LSEIARHTISRVMKNFGAERVSETAADEMAGLTESYIRRITETASKIAKHSGRVTVKKKDIELAVDELHVGVGLSR